MKPSRKTGKAPGSPTMERAPGTVDDTWVEVAFLAKHPRENHWQGVLIRETSDDYFLGQ